MPQASGVCSRDRRADDRGGGLPSLQTDGRSWPLEAIRPASGPSSPRPLTAPPAMEGLEWFSKTFPSKPALEAWPTPGIGGVRLQIAPGSLILGSVVSANHLHGFEQFNVQNTSRPGGARPRGRVGPRVWPAENTGRGSISDKANPGRTSLMAQNSLTQGSSIPWKPLDSRHLIAYDGSKRPEVAKFPDLPSY
jgi:hypothetical protein